MQLRYYFSVLCVVLTLCSGSFLAVSCNREKGESPGPVYSAGSDRFYPAIHEGPDTEAREAGIPVSEPEDAGEYPFRPAALILNTEEGPDIILDSYLNPVFRDGVVAFFGQLTGSSVVAAVVLSHAAVYDINPALAFALCWEESSCNPGAVNYNRNETVDRGLFQLNNASFPNLAPEDFYDPGVNARYGLAHLRWCLNNAGTEVSALAMYNAGHNRVRSAGTPKSTLDYISRILGRQRKIEKLFAAEYTRITHVESLGAGKKEKPPFRLSLLAPLGR